MTFESWLRKQKHRDDPIGDLSKDFISSRTRTLKESFNKFYPCQDAIETYNNACDEYLLFLKNELDIFKSEDEE